MKKVGIVICNYNKADMVKNCIKAVLENRFRDYDVFVVDNASTDASVSVIEKTYLDTHSASYDERVHLIVNKDNLGGSGGFNVGLRRLLQGEYAYFMCIDNDAYLDENAIGALYEHLEQNPGTGIAASRIYHLENPDVVQNYGQKINFEGFYTEVEYLGAFEGEDMPEVNYSDGVPACSLMIRREVVEKIGILPEENFLYWDDTEWCYRCKLAGYQVASIGASQALHSMGARKEDVSTFPTYYAWRNWIRFFIKFTPEEKWFDMVETFLQSLFQAQYEGLLTGQLEKADTIMAAYDDAIHGITGKAGNGRIFSISSNYDTYRAFLEENKVVFLNDTDMPLLSEKIRNMPEKIGCHSPKFILLDEVDDPEEVLNKELEFRETEQSVILNLCYSVFSENVGNVVKDMKYPKQQYFLDENDCLVRADRILEMQRDYKTAGEVFVFSQMPLFLRQIREVRNQDASLSKE